MKIILTPFMVLAAIGLILSMIVHLSAWFGFPSPLGEDSWALHGGIFIVWLPTILVSIKLGKDFKQKDFWKAALRGCPPWMKYLVYFFFGYAFLNFAIFVISVKSGRGTVPDGTPPNIFRGFSGHWMAFYSAALAVLYSALRVQKLDQARRCLNGHPVPPSAKFCEECGAPVIEPSALQDF